LQQRHARIERERPGAARQRAAAYGQRPGTQVIDESVQPQFVTLPFDRGKSFLLASSCYQEVQTVSPSIQDETHTVVGDAKSNIVAFSHSFQSLFAFETNFVII